MISIRPVEGLPEIGEGDDLGALIAERAELADGDVLVVAQKAVSKAEGRVVRLDEVEPSARARELAGGEDPRRLEVILRESARIVRSAAAARDRRDPARLRLRLGRRRLLERARGRHGRPAARGPGRLGRPAARARCAS